MARTIILRTAREKADLVNSWHRPDEEFFASGACHVLAAAFLARYPDAGFSAWRLRPRAPHVCGAHVVVAREDSVFDWAGYAARSDFLAEYHAAMRALIPDWSAELTQLTEDPVGWDFCNARQHRHPSQFPHDPLPRALAHLRKFPAPRATDSRPL